MCFFVYIFVFFFSCFVACDFEILLERGGAQLVLHSSCLRPSLHPCLLACFCFMFDVLFWIEQGGAELVLRSSRVRGVVRDVGKVEHQHRRGQPLPRRKGFGKNAIFRGAGKPLGAEGACPPSTWFVHFISFVLYQYTIFPLTCFFSWVGYIFIYLIYFFISLLFFLILLLFLFYSIHFIHFI